MPNWITLRLKEKAKGVFGEARLANLDKAINVKRSPVNKETVSDFLKRGGRIKQLKPKK